MGRARTRSPRSSKPCAACNTVFTAFYQRAQKGEVGYPRFKPRSRFDQVMFVAGDGSKWEPATGNWAHAQVAGGRHHQGQAAPAVRGTVKTIQLKREHRRWYVIVVADTNPSPLPETGRQVGVDVGVARFYTTSDGEIADNPRFLEQAAERIADLQRRKARCKRGSGNRRRARQALAKAWRKVRNQRRDFHHRHARRLVNGCDVIAVENLNVAGMTRRPQPKPDDAGGYAPNGAAAKAGLNKSILDAGWSQFVGILAAKAEEAGRRVVAVNAAFTSIDCHVCGTRCTRPCQDTVVCPQCGEIDADLNAARNIHTRAGLGSGQAAPAA